MSVGSSDTSCEGRDTDVADSMVAKKAKNKSGIDGEADDYEGEDGASDGRAKKRRNAKKVPLLSMFSTDTLLKLFGVSSRHWETDPADTTDFVNDR